MDGGEWDRIRSRDGRWGAVGAGLSLVVVKETSGDRDLGGGEGPLSVGGEDGRGGGQLRVRDAVLDDDVDAGDVVVGGGGAALCLTPKEKVKVSWRPLVPGVVVGGDWGSLLVRGGGRRGVVSRGAFSRGRVVVGDRAVGDIGGLRKRSVELPLPEGSGVSPLCMGSLVSMVTWLSGSRGYHLYTPPTDTLIKTLMSGVSGDSLRITGSWMYFTGSRGEATHIISLFL